MKPRNSITSPSNVDKQSKTFFESFGTLLSIFKHSSLKHHDIEASVSEAKRQLAIAESNKIISAEIDKKEDLTIAAADAVLTQVHTPRNF